MAELSMSYSKLNQQASETAESYLFRAIASVEAVMGEGAAAKYPAIVAAVIAAAASDYAAAMISHRLVPALDDVSAAIGGVADAISVADA